METVALAASARTKTTKPWNLRSQRLVPGVLYGNNVQNTSFQCDENALLKAYKKAGESTLIQFDLDGTTVPVIVHDIDFDPVSDRITHIDLYAVDMKKEIETSVSLRVVGVSPAVKDQQAILVVVHEHLTVRCLPGDLPHDLPVDIAALADFGDTITVGSIPLPPGVRIMEEAHEVVITVQEPRKEEVIAPVVTADAAAAQAAATSGAEGAAAAPAAAEKKDDAKKGK